MNCDEVQNLLSAWIDGGVSDETDAAVSSHLRGCTPCAQEASVLKEMHARMVRLAPSEASVDRLTNHVLRAWKPSGETIQLAGPASQPENQRTHWQALAAAAMVLVIGIGIWRQVQDNEPGVRHDVPLADSSDDVRVDVVDTTPAVAAGVANVVHTSGTVEVQYLDRGEWLPVSFTPFACPSDAAVRTGDDSLCQVETASGGIVRLDEHATVRVCNSDEIELETGRVWCRAANDGTLQLTPTLAETNPPETVDSLTCLSVPVFCCPSNCSMQAQLTDSNDLQVHSVDGCIDVFSNPFGRQLNSGEAVQIVGGRVDREYEEDALLAMRWMLPLMAANADEVETFTERVLATIGGAKASFVFEADLVQLGEPGAVPLLAFLQSTAADDRVEARQTAARVLSQTAGEAMTNDLINLLSDQDPEVRVSIASALLRLTGEDQGRPPEAWCDNVIELQPTLSAWQQWRESRN